MGLFDFIFGNRKKEEQQRLERERQAREARLAEKRSKEEERKRTERELAESLQPFTFKSNCHQRYENNAPAQGLQECVRTVSVEKNTSGCPGYKLQPGIGYIVKIFNDDLGRPNMSDKPMKVVRKTDSFIELRGFPIEAQSPFGWQEVDYRDYGFVVYYKNGEIEKCVLHMYDRNIRIEYMKNDDLCQNNNINELDIRQVASGYPFEADLYVSVVKQPYGRQSSVVPTTKGAIAKVIRKSQGSNIEIIFSNLAELKSKGLIQSNLSLSPQFNYSKDSDGDEFASAEINNSFAAMASGKEYISLFQITKQNGNFISFLINNLPGVEDYYYLIILDSRKPQ
jgi:hypothetical protein